MNSSDTPAKQATEFSDVFDFFKQCEQNDLLFTVTFRPMNKFRGFFLNGTVSPIELHRHLDNTACRWG